ncbi:unnamed protein product [Callosobruchus maculatus]|uniref:Uncharacterized protein n=1 Tax=Callosobruchus maculatus TaxID=64391 RepID=A0A653BRR4_CALMS|nr:unnamed protein product [Callosobruchus maculatus]
MVPLPSQCAVIARVTGEKVAIDCSCRTRKKPIRIDTSEKCFLTIVFIRRNPSIITTKILRITPNFITQREIVYVENTESSHLTLFSLDICNGQVS